MINNIYYTLLLFVMKNVSIRLNISSSKAINTNIYNMIYVAILLQN